MGSESEVVFGNSGHYVQSYFPIKINAEYFDEYLVKNGLFFLKIVIIDSSLGITICHRGAEDTALFPHPPNDGVCYQSSAAR